MKTLVPLMFNRTLQGEKYPVVCYTILHTGRITIGGPYVSPSEGRDGDGWRRTRRFFVALAADPVRPGGYGLHYAGLLPQHVVATGTYSDRRFAIPVDTTWLAGCSGADGRGDRNTVGAAVHHSSLSNPAGAVQPLVSLDPDRGRLRLARVPGVLGCGRLVPRGVLPDAAHLPTHRELAERQPGARGPAERLALDYATQPADQSACSATI